jgi:hypothetical protein
VRRSVDAAPAPRLLLLLLLLLLLFLLRCWPLHGGPSGL